MIGVTAAVLVATAIARVPERIFETNVTNDLNVASGEPEIAIDPTNPRRIAVIEFGIGSAAAPAALANPNAPTAAGVIASSQNDGRVMLSIDGGDHWRHGLQTDQRCSV